MVNADQALREFVSSIVDGDSAAVSRILAVSPSLATASFEEGASRNSEDAFFIDRIKRYIWRGDTALHIAGAAYRAEIVLRLVAAGADVHAGNRHGGEAIHAAAVGSPRSGYWNPQAQTATIISLIEAGADPNAIDKRGVSPLHIAVRTRCAEAVRVLLEHGADPAKKKNKSGSTPMLLAGMNTGRGGTGSPEAKAQQQEIVRLLEGYCRDRLRPR